MRNKMRMVLLLPETRKEAADLHPQEESMNAERLMSERAFFLLNPAHLTLMVTWTQTTQL